MSLGRLVWKAVERERLAAPGALPGPRAAAGGAPPPPSDEREPGRAARAMEGLVEYIPTEIVTIYVAAVAAHESLPAWASVLNLYLALALATPMVFVLVYMGDRKEAKLSRLPAWKSFPWWALAAATIAFLVWALAIPGHPWTATSEARTVAGIAAVAISTVLRVVGRVVD